MALGGTGEAAEEFKGNVGSGNKSCRASEAAHDNGNANGDGDGKEEMMRR